MQIVLKTMHILLSVLGLFAILINPVLSNYCPGPDRFPPVFLPDRYPLRKICIFPLHVGFCLKT